MGPIDAPGPASTTPGSPSDPDDAALTRYLSGESDAAERTAVERWIAADPAHARLAERLRAAWGPAGEGVAEQQYEVEHIWHAVSRAVAGERTRASGRPHAVAFGQRVAWWPVAAIAGAAFVSIALVRHARHVPRAAADAGSGRTYITAPGERATITLADGTRLTLGPASRLRLAADYGAGSRHVTLEGAALFTVVHDAARPFSVRTARAVTQDLGTRFGVAAYADEPEERVIVAEGRVAVSRACSVGPQAPKGGLPCGLSDSALTIGAGQVATVRERDVAVANRADVAVELAWAEGRLVFRHATVAEAARDIARAFDVDVRVAGPGLAAERVTAAFRTDADSLGSVLSYLALVLDARVERAGRVVTLTGGKSTR